MKNRYGSLPKSLLYEDLEDEVAPPQSTHLPESPDRYREKSSHKGLPNGWTRATFILKEEYVRQIRAVAYWERITLKELLEEALVLYLANKKDITELPIKKIRTS
jgi:hypothetical protein